MKFIRRKELDAVSRLNIVIIALSCQGVYGARTALANKYNISRSFLYQLIGASLLCLESLFNTENTAALPYSLDVDYAIVLLRLEGKVSISSISEILQMQGYEYSSTGMVSEHLKHLGENLPNNLIAKEIHEVFCLSDEIFASSQPILVTLDPVSTAILRIELANDRKADTWKNHFDELREHQFVLTGLSSDRGNGLVKGYQDAYQDFNWCSDHFHELRGLTQLCSRLEKKAYVAIATEQERLDVFNNARSKQNIEKRLQQLDEASAVCEQRMAEYQYVSDVLDILYSTLYFFDLETGKPRYSQQVKADILVLMDLLNELKLSKLKEQTQKIRLHIDDICNCYQQVETIYQQLTKTIPFEILNYIGLAWQHDHQSHQYKGSLKKYHQAEYEFWLEVAKQLLNENNENENNVETKINQAFDKFNAMVRSSSLVEMVNSQIRPYLNNCKGQITQAHLNLIMFYHNHSLYKSGKRKGKAPIEILTGTKLEKNWIEVLLNTVNQTQ
jgi:hypothetical protein